MKRKIDMRKVLYTIKWVILIELISLVIIRTLEIIIAWKGKA